MSRKIMMMILLLSALGTLTSCAESFHQIQRETGALGIPPELEKQVDTSVTFADLKANTDSYIGRIVTVGGIVLMAKRTKEQTEIEILQLPSKGGEISTKDRLRSEGRLIAVRGEFLDPASVPAGTPITVIGAVKGSATRLLDESEYTYPVLEIKHLIDWTTVAAQDSGTESAAFYGPYYPPFWYWGAPYGYFPYSSYRGWHYPYFTQPRPAPPPPPPPVNIHPRLRRR
jgi:outer membrane lipoprotein